MEPVLVLAHSGPCRALRAYSATRAAPDPPGATTYCRPVAWAAGAAAAPPPPPPDAGAGETKDRSDSCATRPRTPTLPNLDAPEAMRC